MRELQSLIIDQLGTVPHIDPEAEVRKRVDFLVEYLHATGARGFVLGISGGVDSTAVGRLAQLAVEKVRAENPDTPADQQPQFYAMRLPYRIQQDEDDARAAMDFVAPDHDITLDIGDSVAGMAAEFKTAVGEPLSDYNQGNVKARMRMVAQYALAGARGALVLGSDHAAESLTGFYTKFGDGAADVMPLYGLNKRQVRQLTAHLGADEVLWAKVPTADLLDDAPGQTDEAELGVSYDVIDDYLEGLDVPEAEAKKIEALYTRSRHKRELPTTLFDTWWQRHPQPNL